MSHSGQTGVFEDLRSHFSAAEWSQLTDGDRTMCLNVMKNHLFKLSIGLRSVPPVFMARVDDGVPGKASFIPKPSVAGQKQHDEWGGLHLSHARTEPDGKTTTPSAKDDNAVPAGVRSVCDLCNRLYSEECEEEREPPAAVADSHDAVAEVRRAGGDALPSRLGTSRSGVADARPGGVFYRDDGELPGERKEAPERDRSVKRKDNIDAKEETLSRREEKTYRLAFAGKRTHASKRHGKGGKSRSEPPTTRRPVHDGGEKPIRCEKCDKRFGRSSDLKRHRRVHAGERPFRCTRCVKRFGEMSHLKAHQRVHDGEKPFRCEQCAKSFSRVGHLEAHRRIHTGEKPFQCTECDRSFSQMAGLGKHGLVHTGEKRSKKK